MYCIPTDPVVLVKALDKLRGWIRFLHGFPEAIGLLDKCGFLFKQFQQTLHDLLIEEGFSLRKEFVHGSISMYVHMGGLHAILAHLHPGLAADSQGVSPGTNEMKMELRCRVQYMVGVLNNVFRLARGATTPFDMVELGDE
jgi:hypothetical protein